MRMTMLKFVSGIGCALILSVQALAADSMTIRSYMADGEFKTARAEAESLGTAEGYALAAESLLSEIMLGQADKNKKQAKRARKLAKAGLELEPAHQNARLQYAIADGFVTRETGDVSAWMKKLPQKTEAIVQAYRTDFPNDVRGDALLGAWHLAIARKAGDKNAQKWFEASIAEGRKLFLAARAAEPNDPIIGLNYAFALIALEDEDLDDTEEAEAILDEIVKLTPSDHLSTVMVSYAKGALARLNNRESAREYVELFLDGKRPE